MDFSLVSTKGGADAKGSRKRRHPDSRVERAPNSQEVLQLIENPNFDELARWSPPFLQAWTAIRQQQKATRNTFSACISQDFTIALTRALLQAYFDLKLVCLDQEHLCPPVPNRFFYVHWVCTQLLSMDSAPTTMSSPPVLGIDIGSGSTAIYSLLAAKFFGVRMLTTEIDPQTAQMATQNVQANQLTSQIQVSLVQPSHSQQPTNQLPPGGPLQRALGQVHGPVHFVMTNPPFYDPADPEPSRLDGRNRTAMTVSEGNYPGGEVGFVTEMIADSVRAPQAARWFTSMLGKKSSLLLLEKCLVHLLGPAHVQVTEYGPGNYTRWFLAWTFQPPVATAPAARVPLPANQSTFVVSVDKVAQEALQEVTSRILAYCESSPGGWKLSAVPSPQQQPSSVSCHAELFLQELQPRPFSKFVDETETPPQFPPCILEALNEPTLDSSGWLPAQGHFVVRLLLDTKPGTGSTSSSSEVHVRLEGYRHSARGLVAIKKIGSTIQGEICRTNRKWRRILQRQ
eukprot:Nitzschia sp. Nitz4//scaffold42_size132992//85799//87337//NITZ4_003407-RA/size132992-processed-gene-0.39-mRNA-1//-1//CDS//3329551742//7953//frame0